LIFLNENMCKLTVHMNLNIKGAKHHGQSRTFISYSHGRMR
jgi:hypothetical protein